MQFIYILVLEDIIDSDVGGGWFFMAHIVHLSGTVHQRAATDIHMRLRMYEDCGDGRWQTLMYIDVNVALTTCSWRLVWWCHEVQI